MARHSDQRLRLIGSRRDRLWGGVKTQPDEAEDHPNAADE